MTSAVQSMSSVRSGSRLPMPSRSASLHPVVVALNVGASGGADATSRGCVEKRRTLAKGLVDKRGMLTVGWRREGRWQMKRLRGASDGLWQPADAGADNLGQSKVSAPATFLHLSRQDAWKMF